MVCIEQSPDVALHCRPICQMKELEADLVPNMEARTAEMIYLREQSEVAIAILGESTDSFDP